MFFNILQMSGNGANNTTPPSTKGAAYQGGYYAGNYSSGGKTYAVVVAPKATGESQTRLMNQSQLTSGATSTSDSLANTNSLFSTGNSPAATWVKGLTIGGYNDWVIPSLDILQLISQNLRPDLTTIAPNFQTGGADAFTNGTSYWSSTTYDWVRNDSYYSGGDPIYGWVDHTSTTTSTSYFQGTENFTTDDAGASFISPGTVCSDGGGYVASGASVSQARYDNGAGFSGGRYNYVTSVAYCAITTTTTTTTQSWEVIGYTDTVYNEQYTQMYQAYDALIGPSYSTGLVDKVNTYPVRAVRLVILN